MTMTNIVQLGYDLYLVSDLTCAVACIRRPEPGETAEPELRQRFPPRAKIRAVVVLRDGQKHATTLNPLGVATRLGFARPRKNNAKKSAARAKNQTG